MNLRYIEEDGTAWLVYQMVLRVWDWRRTNSRKKQKRKPINPDLLGWWFWTSGLKELKEEEEERRKNKRAITEPHVTWFWSPPPVTWYSKSPTTCVYIRLPSVQPYQSRAKYIHPSCICHPSVCHSCQHIHLYLLLHCDDRFVFSRDDCCIERFT